MEIGSMLLVVGFVGFSGMCLVWFFRLEVSRSVLQNFV